MRNILRVACLSLWAVVAAGSPVAASSPMLIGCGGGYDPTAASMPLGPGPLTLVKINCLDALPTTEYPEFPPDLSPDEKALFGFYRGGVWVFGPEPRSSHRHFGTGYPWIDAPFAWSKDSRSIFGVGVKLAGYSIEPFLFSLDGTDQRLPTISNPAGPIAAIDWAGSDGMAVALFGLRTPDRPLRKNPHAIMAIVDVRAGRMIQAIEIGSLPGLSLDGGLHAIASRVDDRGRVHTLIRFSPDQWVVWVRGEQPRLVSIGTKPFSSKFTMTPDGGSALVVDNLTATGVICERDPHCPEPKPSHGTIAELRDLSSGRLIWSVAGAAKELSNVDAPAISPDGRHALITMPNEGARQPIALVSMASGQILQEIPKPAPGYCTMRFSADGKSVWLSGGWLLVQYRMR